MTTPRHWGRARLALVGALAATLAGGCTIDELGSGRPSGAAARGEPPAYEDIAEAYNRRVDGLERLWAHAVVRVEGEDAQGKALREQAEGHLQVVLPDRLALSMGKVGKPLLQLGCDESRYWWFDALANEPVGLVGRHELATPRKSAALGLPVHPLDLIELIGMTPLPAGDRTVGWSKDGTLAVFNVPARWGSRWVWVDPQTLEPMKIALADESLAILAEAELSHYEIVRIEGDATRRPMIATRAVIRTPAFDGFARITLSDPRNRTISNVPFDFEGLQQRYGVAEPVDVDDPRLWAEARGDGE